MMPQDEEENAGEDQQQDNPEPLAAFPGGGPGRHAGRAGQLVIWRDGRLGRFLIHLVCVHHSSQLSRKSGGQKVIFWRAISDCRGGRQCDVSPQLLLASLIAGRGGQALCLQILILPKFGVILWTIEACRWLQKPLGINYHPGAAPGSLPG